MNNTNNDSDTRIALSATHFERFHRLATEALKARSGGFLLEQVGVGVEWILLGLVPIVGMLQFGWNAGELLGFLIAGAWIGIVAEVIRFALFYQPMKFER